MHSYIYAGDSIRVLKAISLTTPPPLGGTFNTLKFCEINTQVKNFFHFGGSLDTVKCLFNSRFW